MKKIIFVLLMMCPALVFAGGEAPGGFVQLDAETLSIILGALWVFSEALAQIPAVKGNSVFQAIAGLLEKIGQPKGQGKISG